jgi:hypothetical protein
MIQKKTGHPLRNAPLSACSALFNFSAGLRADSPGFLRTVAEFQRRHASAPVEAGIWDGVILSI